MSYDPSDAAYDQFVDELYEEFRDSALEDDQLYNRVVEDFKESRLRDYYIDHPLVAKAAQDALAEAQELRGGHPRTALVLAVIAAEVCLRDALLAPILHGSFHTGSTADLVVKLVVAGKDEKLINALVRVLAAHTRIDLRQFGRSGSGKALWEEMREIQVKRNRIVHQAERASVEEADAAIEVAKATLYQVFGGTISNLGLHLHENVRVCALPKCPEAGAP